MKQAFLFSDLHCSKKNLNKLYDFVIQNKNIKVLVFAGDVTNFGKPVEVMEQFIKTIEKINLPFVWVPGNNDFGESYKLLQEKYKSLEGRVVEVSGQKFTGVGGSPASWSGQYEGENMISKEKIAGSIFVSHYPPPNLLNLSREDNLSPTSNKKYSNSPIVHICGHLHNLWGVSYLGQTKVIKLASLETGHYAILDLENIHVEFGRL